MKRVLYWAVIVPLAVVVVLLFLGFMLWVLSVASPAVSAASVVTLALAALWFFLARRKSAGAVTEASLMGRQSSTEGLL